MLRLARRLPGDYGDVMTKRGLETAQPGDRVRFTGYYLRATGQTTGTAGASRWTVVACACSLCVSGKYVATDEPGFYEEGPRHIALSNLELVGKLPRAVDMADAVPVGPYPTRKKK